MCSFLSVDHKHEADVKDENHQAPYADINLGLNAGRPSFHRTDRWAEGHRANSATLLLKIRPHCSRRPEVTRSTACNINYSFRCELHILPFIHNVTMHCTFLKFVFCNRLIIYEFISMFCHLCSFSLCPHRAEWVHTVQSGSTQSRVGPRATTCTYNQWGPANRQVWRKSAETLQAGRFKLKDSSTDLWSTMLLLPNTKLVQCMKLFSFNHKSNKKLVKQMYFCFWWSTDRLLVLNLQM